MPANTKIYSIYRSLLIYVITLVIGITLAGVVSSSYFTVEEAKRSLAASAQNLSTLIAQQSIEAIENNQVQTLEKYLSNFNQLTFINYIHIYKVQENSSQVNYFTSYNKNANYPSIPDKINQIAALQQVNFNHKYAELITPIYNSDQLVGYIYLQLNNYNINNLKSDALLVSVVILFAFVAVALFFIARLTRTITHPLKSITQTIQQIAQNKDYNVRCEQEAYKEADILAKNLNVLLTRTELKFNKLHIKHQEILSENQSLKDKVNIRSDALKESNQELLTTLEKLHQFQGQLVESEKMASLGDMVAGVAHEVNTPIGLGVTASTLLLDRIKELKDAFENKTLKSSQLKRFLTEGDENVSIIYRNLNRAADLISSFKKVAVDQSNEEDRQFDVKELIDEVLLTLAPQLKKQPVSIEILCPDNLIVTSKPGPINQILINLIINSILHAFDGIEDKLITINVMNLSDQLSISYSDNGNGVDPSIKNKIFDPFITTKRGSGGSGLGLHLVYNLVTQALGGHIHLESDNEQGVLFEINFPVKISKN